MSSSDYPIATGVPGLVSAIVLNWNGGEEVLKCIEHLVRQSYAQLEILLVDNGSTDGSAKIAQERFPRIAVYKNGRNLGYAEGMNIGIGHSAGEYVLLLNQDAFLEPDYLEQGVKLFGDSETIGMIAGTVLNVGSEKNPSIREVHRGFMMRWQMRPTRNRKSAPGQIIFGPTFACALIRRSALEDVRCACYGDYLDRDYFAYFEDIDLCFRMVMRGWQTAYSPVLVARHSYASATGHKVRTIEKPLLLQRHIFKNRYITIIKDLPLSILLRVVPLVTITDAFLLVYLLFRSPRSLLAWTAACFDVLRLLPKIQRRRMSIQAGMLISVEQLRQYFVRL
jgi:GT2 family glycosyltransferase